MCICSDTTTDLGDDLDTVSNQVARVEPHTKLTYHGDVSSSLWGERGGGREGGREGEGEEERGREGEERDRDGWDGGVGWGSPTTTVNLHNHFLIRWDKGIPVS